jgi:hypothetical protein
LSATVQDVADRLLLSVEDVERALSEGNRELQRIIDEDFDADELRELTEGRIVTSGDQR